MTCPVTAESLSVDDIKQWLALTPMHYEHVLCSLDARGLSGGPCYRDPRPLEIANARARIAAELNARNGGQR